MKISFIVPGGGRSGGVKCTVNAASGLCQKGHQVRILYKDRKTFSRKTLSDIYRKLSYPNSSCWLKGCKADTEPFKVISDCVFDKDEIVIGAGMWACQQISNIDNNDIRKFHYLHEEIPWDVESMKKVLQKDVPKIVVAPHLRRRVKELAVKDVAAVVPNGIDNAEFFPQTTVSHRSGIGTIYGHSRHKAPETLLAVLKKLRKRYPAMPIRVFGSSRKPPDFDEIGHLTYTRLASVEQARNIYSNTLVWILASRSEGFGLPILEAMACGSAVVATDCGGPADIIESGVNGLLAQVDDVDNITQRVSMLFELSRLREKCVANGFETIKKYNWADSVDKLETVLRDRK